jgi:hypothetical protein
MESIRKNEDLAEDRADRAAAEDRLLSRGSPEFCLYTPHHSVRENLHLRSSHPFDVLLLRRQNASKATMPRKALPFSLATMISQT